MYSPDSGEPKMTTAAIHPMIGRHWVKRLARALGVPHETARFWVYKRMPDAKRAAIAAALLAECDYLESVIKETRKKWAGVADAASGAVVGRGADRDGPAARRVGDEVS